MEVANRPRAHVTHAGLQRAEQVLRPVVEVGRAHENLGQRTGDQFRQAGGMQQAAGDACGKGVASARQYRQSDPKGVTGSGMRVVRQGIEKQYSG